MDEETTRQQPKVIDLELRDYRADGVKGEKLIHWDGVIRLALFVVIVVVMYNAKAFLTDLVKQVVGPIF